jgi:hypothetical protein
LILFLVVGPLSLAVFGVYLARRRRLEVSASSAFPPCVSITRLRPLVAVALPIHCLHLLSFPVVFLPMRRYAALFPLRSLFTAFTSSFSSWSPGAHLVGVGGILVPLRSLFTAFTSSPSFGVVFSMSWGQLRGRVLTSR